MVDVEKVAGGTPTWIITNFISVIAANLELEVANINENTTTCIDAWISLAANFLML